MAPGSCAWRGRSRCYGYSFTTYLKSRVPAYWYAGRKAIGRYEVIVAAPGSRTSTSTCTCHEYVYEHVIT